MSQADFTIADQDGASFLVDINAQLVAIVSQSSGATEPATTYAYQYWADTSAGILKRRNAANSAWIDEIDLATGAPVVLTEDTGSSLVNFLQSGTGAVARTVQAKLRETISVKDFGAVGDGVTDDTPAIRLAIDYAVSIGGGTVYFPEGTYIISRDPSAVGVPIYSNIHLVGAGINATTLKGQAGTGTMHLISTIGNGNNNMSVRDMTLDHNGVNIGASAGCHGLRFVEAYNVWIERIALKNTDQHGIVTLTNGSGDISSVNNTFFVSDVYLENIGVSGRNGGDGIRIFYGADKITINNIICNGVEYHGIHAGKGVGTISNVQMFNCGNVGLEIQSEGLLATNIHIEWNDVIVDLFANRPAAGNMGRLFRATDTTAWYRDNGTSWQDLTANLSGVWLSIRDVTYDLVQRISLSNIKCVFNVTENQPYTVNTGDGIRIEGEKIQLNNIIVSGKFRFGLLTAGSMSNFLQISNAIFEGVRHDGIRLDGINFPQMVNVSILSAGQEAGTYYGVNLRGTQNTRFIGGYINDVSGVTQGVNESLGGEVGTRIIGSHLTKSNLTYSGRMTGNINNTGYITSAGGTGTIASGSTTATITHGLSTTPNSNNISITQRGAATNDVGMVWVSNITSTEFTLNVSNNPGASGFLYAWRISPG